MSSIDIVVPCYRYGRYLRECVESVLSQGISDCRILIIDDESPDETPQVGHALASEDSRVTYRRHVANQGHISTYNEGIEWCESNFMLLLSADDYLVPGALQRAMRLMEQNPKVGLCFGDAIETYPDGHTRRISTTADLRGKPSDVLTGAEFVRLCIASNANNIVPTPTAVVRTSLLKRVGGYRADLPHSGDIELWLRLAAHGPVAILKAEQAVYRRHDANMSTGYFGDYRLSDLKQREAAFAVFLKNCLGVLPEAKELHASLLEGLSQEAMRAASDAFNDGCRTQMDDLLSLATRLHPGIRKSFEWKMLAGKRLIGVQATNVLRPLVAKLR